MNNIITLIIAVLGSGGLSAVLTSILSARKSNAEAKILLQEAEAKHLQTERDCDKYIHDQLKEMTETHRKESEALRTMNKELNIRIAELEVKINKLLDWVVVDNGTYRAWLETELRKYNPEITFPKCRPAPGFDERDEESESDS